ncbi:hypothetical protein B1207_08560 [Legionella quinlivanii]|uniref:Ankyrin repeat-containing protein n=1 Tax=Legionella quinlivanii TaxID=45073 RepID=A0A364LII2_9GAMM|nr:hypothetical protein [Legionella quinlivanii]RAP36194.1 hypothetical protein B1207_08560 [Legionella quinlivanii]
MSNKSPLPDFGFTSVKGMEQAYVIPMINLILQEGDIKLSANDNGICNGLAAVYVQYALEGKSSQFAKILDAINRKGELLAQKTDPESIQNQTVSDSEINKFIQEVLNAYLPQEFNKKLSQEDAVLNLKVPVAQPAPGPDGDVTTVNVPMKLQRVYNIGLVAERGDWRNIFNRMRVPDTAWTVRTPTHAIAVSVNKEGNFEVYDPNNNKIRVFKDGDKVNAASKLANFLSREAFATEQGPLETIPLTINVMAHPESTIAPDSFPDKENFIIKNIIKNNPERANASADVGDNVHFNQLTMAAIQDDKDLIEAWFRNGASDSRMALKMAARDNKLEAMTILLDEQYRNFLNDADGDPSVAYLAASKIALQAGRLEAFEKLLADDFVRDTLDKHVQNEQHGKVYQLFLLKGAAASRNPECVKAVVNYLNQSVPNLNLAALIKSEDVLQIARNADDKRCLNILMALAEKPLAAHDADNDYTSSEDIHYPQNEEETKQYVSRLPSFTELLSRLWNWIKSGFTSAKSEQSKIAEQDEAMKPLIATTQHYKSRAREIREENSSPEADSTNDEELSTQNSHSMT